MTLIDALGTVQRTIKSLVGVVVIWYAAQLYQAGYIFPMVTETPIEATFYLFLMAGIVMMK